MIETCPYCGSEMPPKVEVVTEKYPDGSLKKWTEEIRDSHEMLIQKRVIK